MQSPYTLSQAIRDRGVVLTKKTKIILGFFLLYIGLAYLSAPFFILSYNHKEIKEIETALQQAPVELANKLLAMDDAWERSQMTKQFSEEYGRLIKMYQSEVADYNILAGLFSPQIRVLGYFGIGVDLPQKITPIDTGKADKITTKRRKANKSF